MPLRAAKTLIPLALAVLITAEAVALMTAVTPPDWAYSRVPLDMVGPWSGEGHCRDITGMR